MKWLRRYLSNNPLSILIIALPLALIANWGHWNTLWVFIFSALGVIPMAGFIGQATETLAEQTGPRIGGLLNATLGNAAELIITLVAIRAGLVELVKASITGSIIGNLLLVMGFSMVFGGVGHGIQHFDKRQSGNQAILLALATLALAIPTIFSHSIGPEGSPNVEFLSLGVAVIMIVLYGFGLFYSLKSTGSPLTYESHQDKIRPSKSELRNALLLLAGATIGVVILSELLVGSIEAVVSNFGLSEFFLGIILIPIVGNVAEHIVAVQAAARNDMDLSVEIAVSSSLQIALFVAPLLIFVSLLMGNPLTIVFNLFELAALGSAVLITVMVSADGESNWLEGAALMAVYLILSISFFFLPT